MNIEDGSSDEPEDVEETLRDFLERELGFHDARSVEIQRVYRSGKNKNAQCILNGLIQSMTGQPPQRILNRNTT